MTTIHLLRGRVAIRPDELTSYAIIVPGRDPNDRSGTRTGTVVAMGPPALTPMRFRDDQWVGGVEVDPGFTVGQRVLYAYGQITAPLPGHPDCEWCSQEEILGVIDG